MLANYLTCAIRALLRDRFHTALNIVGLAVSLAAALLIALYVQHEFSYENFFTDPGRVYRVDISYAPPGQLPIATTFSPYPTVDALNADYASQLVATRLGTQSKIVTIGDTHLRQDILAAKDNLFDVLDFPVAYGNPAAALKEPGAVILTEAKAMQLFGMADAIGKDMRIGDTAFRVGAVLKTLPDNTQFAFDALVSEQAQGFEMSASMQENWNAADNWTYFRMRGAGDVRPIADQMPAFADRHIPTSQGSAKFMKFQVRPLRDIHLKAGDAFFPSNRNAVALDALAGTALLLILVAGFNYVNLATARATLRRPEVGLRKILGGSTAQLVTQLMGETLAVTVPAFLLAMLLAALFLPVFAVVTDRPLSLASALSPAYLAFGFGLFVFISLAAGAYPAFFLASSRPVALFQKQRASVGGRNLLRSVMVGVQFSLTVGLLIVAATVFSQVRYLENFNLEFKKDGILVITPYHGYEADSRILTLRDELARSPYFSAAAASSGAPDAAFEMNESLFTKAGDMQTMKNAMFIFADTDFFKVYGLAPVAGRVFSAESATDASEKARTASIILSESAVPYYGFQSASQAIGQVIYAYRAGGTPAEYEVIGVVPDIQLRLGREANKPLVYHSNLAELSQISARVAGDVPAAVHDASQLWSQLFPEQPFSYDFIEDRVTKANADDTRLSQLFAFFTGLAIIVACLGLFGLASFVAARRTKEVAIRKVLGASTGRITGLLLWDFAKPVLLANLIAWPVAWLLMRQWLNGFPYRVTLSPAFFLCASALALAVALLTVFARIRRAARIRPATALKYE